MKKSLPLLIVAFFGMISCSNREIVREISYPFIHSSLFEFTDVTKIERTDTATIISFSSTFIPDFEMDTDSDWKISACGKDYPAKGGIGMTPGEKIVFDDNSKAEFSVIYEAIPKCAKSIDILGGVDIFYFFGVDLTGSAKEIQDKRIIYQEDLPGPWAFKEKFDESTIRVHLLNYRSGMKSEFYYGIFGLIDSVGGEMHVDEKGEATVAFHQNGSAFYQIGFNVAQTGIDGIINPGETIDVTIDLNCFGNNIMRGRDNYSESGIHYYSTSDRQLSVKEKLPNRHLPLRGIFDLPELADTTEIAIAETYVGKAKNGKLSEEDFQKIESFKWDFLKKTLYSINTEVLEKQTPDSYETVEEWEGAEEWIEKIIEPYKGKVVMIDLWNTWCSPCRHAISENEPLKDDVLSSDEFVWIYIADESSPVLDYQEAIKGIRGVHYRLSKTLSKELDTFFNVDGIPFYVLVERDGTFNGRPDLRDHSQYVQELLNRTRSDVHVPLSIAN